MRCSAVPGRPRRGSALIGVTPRGLARRIVNWTPVPGMPDGSFALADLPFELALAGDLDGTRIVATQKGAPAFELLVTDGRLAVRLPQDDGAIVYEAPLTSAADLRILHDRGIIEVFAGHGAICGTRRNYTNVAPDKVVVTSAARFGMAARRAAAAG